jgi:hypothetical protein
MGRFADIGQAHSAIRGEEERRAKMVVKPVKIMTDIDCTLELNTAWR